MKHSRRDFMKNCVALSALATTSGLARAATKKRNVLFIAVDDLRTELGCYGVHYARSPNLDKLASEGVLFTNHFTQVPTCGASRFTMLTGRDPFNSGVVGSNHAFYQGSTALNPEQQSGAQSMPELFRRSGYRTVGIGKLSHTPEGKVFAYDGTGDGRPEMPHAWDEMGTPLGPWKRGWGTFFAYADGRHREDGQGNMDLMEFKVEKDEDLPDGLIAARAVKKLRELKDGDQPFFLGVGFYKPHLPFVAPKKDWDAMLKVDVPPPEHQDKPDSAYWHTSGEFFKYDAPYEKTRPLAVESQIMARRAYLACVRYTDRQIGKVLAELDALGLAESTTVVVWGDHGWQLGESQLWAKHTPHERAVRSTLMVRAPGVSKPGLRCDALVESLDLYPTLVDLADPSFTKTQYRLDGLSLRPLLSGRKKKVRDAAFSFWKGAITVRTATHRLIARESKGEYIDVELYDITKSSDPIANIADAKPELVKELLNAINKRKNRRIGQMKN